MEKQCQCNNKNLCKCPQDNNFEEVATFLEVIHEPNRLKILSCLNQGEKCVCDIREDLNLPQNLVSHHLKVLKDFQLIDYKREGRKLIYYIYRENLNYYINKINNFLI